MPPPLILAHRGASAYAPENTIAAFQLARELGADGIELDVQLTRDKIPVVIHDDTVDRTTDGHGRVSDMTIAEIARLDAGAWKTEDYRGEPIPTLAQVFDALSDWLKPVGRERPCLLNVELKTELFITDGLELQVMNLIARYGIQERILLSSFSPMSLTRAKKFNSRVRRGFLFDASLPSFFRASIGRLWTGAATMHPEHLLVNAGYMNWAKRANVGIVPWTVDDPDEGNRLANLGVNAIITNKPDVIREALYPKKI